MRPGEERIYPKQVQTVGNMLTALPLGWRVTVRCTQCEGIEETGLIFLMWLCMTYGPDLSLIDVHMPCVAPGCGGCLLWHYSPSEGTPFRRL